MIIWLFFDNFVCEVLWPRRGSPSQKNQKFKFDSFDYLIILILKKISTHRQNDRQTFGLIEATCRRLKRVKMINIKCYSGCMLYGVWCRFPTASIIRLSQPSLPGVGAGWLRLSLALWFPTDWCTLLSTLQFSPASASSSSSDHIWYTIGMTLKKNTNYLVTLI